MKKCDTQKRLILPADMQQNQQTKKWRLLLNAITGIEPRIYSACASRMAIIMPQQTDIFMAY